MPRQAARLVLGRSARTSIPTETPSSRLQPFSTTPRTWADLDGTNNNRKNNGDSSSSAPARRGRSVAAASALGAMSSKTGENRFAGQRSILARPAGLGRPGNVISMKSLPQRADGAPRPLIRRPSQLGDRPPPGSSGFTPRFAGRSGADNFGGRGGFPRGGSGRGGAMRGRGGRGRGRGRGRRGGARGGRESKEDGGGERHELDSDDLIGMPVGETIEQHVKEVEQAGPARAYKPSTSLESLVGWGPAVATNTAMGQAETALRAMRIMGGGRAHAELEQSFRLTDLMRWDSASKPIMYSRIEQKEASEKMQRPDWADKLADERLQAMIGSFKKKHGDNYEQFVKDFNSYGSLAAQREKGKKKFEAEFARHVEDVPLQRTKNKVTKEAIIKFGIKGEHPEVKYSTDKWAKLANYHAHGATYRPADAAKFDEKMRSLVRQ